MISRKSIDDVKLKKFDNEQIIRLPAKLNSTILRYPAFKILYDLSELSLHHLCRFTYTTHSEDQRGIVRSYLSGSL